MTGRDAAPTTRVDPHLGTVVHVVGARQARPNLPSSGCPFCPGGLEAPDRYDVRWFPNRWPAMEGDRCEVVLYTPQHDASFSSLGVDGARKVIDLWAERTARSAPATTSTSCSCFENRGPEVGATIAHPHGQIYAYDHVPDRQPRRLAGGWAPDRSARAMRARRGSRSAVGGRGCRTRRPSRSRWRSRRVERVADLPSMADARRDGLAALLIDVLGRLDRLYDQPLPYMMWLNQRPDGGDGYDRRVVQHRDRVAVARRQRAALHRRRRGRLRRVLQPGHPRGPRRPAAFRQVRSTACSR